MGCILSKWLSGTYTKQFSTSTSKIWSSSLILLLYRGDHTCVDFYLAVVPPQTECVVFSVDGSFTASVSVTGKDPKVRAGAVDIVR